AVPQIGHRQIRNRGTFGGSLAHADPSAELPLVVTLLDAEIRTRRGDQSAGYSPDAFFDGYLTTALRPDELLTEVILPPWPAGAGWSFLEVSPRQGDFALVSAAAVVQLDSDRRISLLRLGLGGCAPAPRRIPAVEALAYGRAIDEALLNEIVEVVRASIDPETDIHASAEYRRDVAGTLARRAVKQAAARASTPGVR
ncbi:MAG TPA: FAD binding domain-containing protein, partial [Dehalococcoidia bacterium]|nr:FAD binding domain-containing protein [Dehalococcoidia bacterium]